MAPNGLQARKDTAQRRVKRHKKSSHGRHDPVREQHGTRTLAAPPRSIRSRNVASAIRNGGRRTPSRRLLREKVLQERDEGKFFIRKPSKNRPKTCEKANFRIKEQIKGKSLRPAPGGRAAHADRGVLAGAGPPMPAGGSPGVRAGRGLHAGQAPGRAARQTAMPTAGAQGCGDQPLRMSASSRAAPGKSAPPLTSNTRTRLSTST